MTRFYVYVALPQKHLHAVEGPAQDRGKTSGDVEDDLEGVLQDVSTTYIMCHMVIISQNMFSMMGSTYCCVSESVLQDGKYLLYCTLPSSTLNCGEPFIAKCNMTYS